MASTVLLQRIRDSERELQRVFDAWPFRAARPQTLTLGAREYVLVGCPSWLNARRRSRLATTLTSSMGHDFRPDLVWESDDQSFVIELKSSDKYEPIALPEVLHHALMIERLAQDRQIALPRPVIPVMVTQYNVWLRAALEFLFAHGLGRDALHYLEFDALRFPPSAAGEAERRILWFDEPFAPWTPANPPPEVVDSVREVAPGHRHWHRIDATGTWVATEREQKEQGARPLFVEGSYTMAAPAGPGSLLLWSGSGEVAGAYRLCSLEQGHAAARVASPRLADPAQAADFQMVVGDEAGGRRA